MRKFFVRTIGMLVLLAVIGGLAVGYKFAKGRLHWFVPVNGAQLQINGIAGKGMSLYRATEDRTMVLIRRDGIERQTYIMLGPGPGHLPEGFKGRIRRCESVFVASPFFAFADDLAECVAPTTNVTKIEKPNFRQDS